MDLPNTCRCCLAQGECHKDLNTIYHRMNKKEVYSEMLRDCFNISLSPSSYNSICDQCISSLRNCMVFKRTVLQAEKEFLKHIEPLSETKCLIKLEPDYMMNFDLDSDDSSSDDYFLTDIKKENDDLLLNIKNEHTTRTKSKLKSPSTKRVTNKNIRKQDSRTTIKSLVQRLASLSNLPDLTITKNQSSSKKPNQNKSKSLTQLDKKGNTKNRFANSKTPVQTLVFSGSKEKDKHKWNLTTILQCSNCTPFRNKTLLGYICFYCEEPFANPENLRNHSFTDHREDRKNIKKAHLKEFMVHVDVTDLKCTLCQANLDDMNGLRSHLVDVHKKKIFTDIKDHIVQYKLKQGENYDCCMCPAKYETFKTLRQHMNGHYRNFDCPKCDSSFTTKRSLQVHSSIHQEGIFKCSMCDKVFTTLIKKNYHEKCSHKKLRPVGKCPYCKETFKSYYMRNQHLVKEHNAEAQYKCNSCSKTFLLKSLLMQHIKKLHLMEKNAICNICGYRFFSTKSLKNHMLKHTGEKKFTCQVCNKSYGRKYTLREHMRIHDNDRRFRCEICAMTFVQKCSLKSHLMSNHGIDMPASEITAIDNSVSISDITDA